MDLNTLNLRKARVFAEDAHQGQIRKFEGGPYLAHPIRVALAVLMHSGTTEDMVVAALLHDTVEDTSVTPEEIQAKFGENVSNLVCELTNSTKRLRVSWEVIKRIDRERLAQCSDQAKVIKMVDRIDNLRSCGEASREWRVQYAKESLRLVTVIGEADLQLGEELAEVATLMLLEKHNG